MGGLSDPTKFAQSVAGAEACFWCPVSFPRAAAQGSGLLILTPFCFIYVIFAFVVNGGPHGGTRRNTQSPPSLPVSSAARCAVSPAGCPPVHGDTWEWARDALHPAWAFGPPPPSYSLAVTMTSRKCHTFSKKLTQGRVTKT